MKNFKRMDSIAKITVMCILAYAIFILVVLKVIAHNSAKSQLGQDQKVISYFNNKVNGYFVEVGAYDGLSGSNSIILERDYNWKGICVEPIPRTFEKLSKNRPKCINVPYVAYNHNNLEVEMTELEGLSSVTYDLDKWKDKVLSEGIGKHLLKTKTLTKILDESDAPPYIEYLSIDTEGSELKVLEGIDFNRYKFGFITIEHNGVETKRLQIRKLLESNGYIFKEDIANIDDVYTLNRSNSIF